MGAASRGFGRRDSLTDEERARIIRELSKIEEGSLVLAEKDVPRLVDLVDKALQTAYLHQIPSGFDWRNDPKNIGLYENVKRDVLKYAHSLIESASELSRILREYSADVCGNSNLGVAIATGELDEALNEAVTGPSEQSHAHLIRHALKLLANLEPRPVVPRPRSRPPAHDELRYLTRAVCYWREMEGLLTQYYWRNTGQPEGPTYVTVLIQKVATQFGVDLNKSRVATHLRLYQDEMKNRSHGRTGQDDFSEFWS